MKRIYLALLFACFAFVLAAQDDIKVNYQGAKPTIEDFAKALLLSPAADESDCDESSNAAAKALERYQKGEAMSANEKFTLDLKNGFLLYEEQYDDPENGKYLMRYEMCYWNESDQKHKLIAYSVNCFHNGNLEPGQFDGLYFYRYDNATKKMSFYTEAGFDVQYYTEDGAQVSYSLPRSGKDITETYWYKNSKKEKTLKWNGHQFTRSNSK